jgi:Tol biopolymer transport system component
LTNRVGYDGGAFYSHDGSKLVLRSSPPQSEEEERRYVELLGQALVQPTRMELVVMDRDGGDFTQITSNGKANFAPYWLPDNERIIFASNMADPRGRDFDLYLIREDGTDLQRVTFNDSFDSFPMFSPDGRYLVFASNRYGSEAGETNVFIAEWVED